MQVECYRVIKSGSTDSHGTVQEAIENSAYPVTEAKYKSQQTDEAVKKEEK